MTEYYHEGCTGTFVVLDIADLNGCSWNWHEEIEIAVCLRGNITFFVDGRRCDMKEDDIVVMNSNAVHILPVIRPDNVLMVALVPPDVLVEAGLTTRFDCVTDATTRNSTSARRLRFDMARAALALRDGSTAQDLLIEGAVKTLCAELATQFPAPPAPETTPLERKHRDAARRMIDYMRANYNQKITLDDIARVSGYNRTYVSTLFKADIGINAYDFLTKIRFQHAIFDLNKTDKSITDIAIENGFPDLKALTSYFKKQFHKTPSEYRSDADGKVHRCGGTFAGSVSEGKRQGMPTDDKHIARKIDEYLHAPLYGPAPAIDAMQTYREANDDTNLQEVVDKIRQLGRDLSRFRLTRQAKGAVVGRD